jgi:hypothetical protein
MRPAKYFYDNPLLKYLDPKSVLIYRPHPVYITQWANTVWIGDTKPDDTSFYSRLMVRFLMAT